MSLSLACAHAFRQRKNIKLFYYMCSVYSMYMYIYVYCIIHDTLTVTEIRSLFSLASNTHERWSFSFSILFHVEIIKKTVHRRVQCTTLYVHDDWVAYVLLLNFFNGHSNLRALQSRIRLPFNALIIIFVVSKSCKMPLWKGTFSQIILCLALKLGCIALG